MSRFTVSMWVEIEADTQEDAWEMAQLIATNIQRNEDAYDTCVNDVEEIV